jgi:predicted metal-dependent phosphoesterase TrpH
MKTPEALLCLHPFIIWMASRADIHVHSKYSGLARLWFLRFPESVNEPEDIVKRARAVGLDTVCVTDHNTVRGGILAKQFAKGYDGVSVVVGEEISTEEGEILGLFLNEDIPKDLPAAEAVDRIRSQGGLVIAPHPFSMHVPALGYEVDRLDIDGLEVFNAGHVDGFANNRALQHSKLGRWARLAGSDSHSLGTLGCAFTEFEGSGEEDLRKAILMKSTVPKGSPMSVESGVKWTMEVVLESDRQIIKSMLNRPGKDPDDPVYKKVSELPGHKRIAALGASFLYIAPPIPYLVVWFGALRMRRINSIPIHDPNGHASKTF